MNLATRSIVFVTVIIVIFVGIPIHVTEAASSPTCSYKSASGETVFLTYLPYLKKGEDYVDFGNDGKCIRRATCSDRFQTEVEECSKFPITCANKKSYSGVFPACCIKC